jgi:acetolactate synthase-1/2/3 large subunit
LNAPEKTANPKQSAATSPMIGGHILADALVHQGVDTIFGVPGESYLAVLDGLYRHKDAVRFVICRQEGGAAFMADAYAKLTGKPGVVMVTRGPGATNASIGVHAAHQDSVPMIVLVGQVGGDFVDREAFQEIDYRRMFGPMAKWVAQVDRADRLPEYLAHAFQVATSGRMGPVVLALPEDMLTSTASVTHPPRHIPVRASASPAQVEQFRSMLAAARRPLLMLGGTGWNAAACADMRAFAENNHLPVTCAFRFQDLFDNRHPQYVGDIGIGINPKLAARVRSSDLIIAIGPRLGEMTTSGYSLLAVPRPAQGLIHVHPGIEELGSVYHGDLMIASGMPEIAAALREVRIEAPGWIDDTRQARSEYEAWQCRPALYDGIEPELDLWEVMQTITRVVPDDAIITNGAGNFATWAHRFWPYSGLRTQLASTSGAMGYGLPAAVAASICEPGRTTICVAGDGDFLMTAQELATAVQHGGAPLVIVFNNGMYGTIRMHQEREYPAREHGTRLINPDFVKYVEAFGGWGAKVSRTSEFEPALHGALDAMRREKRPALIELAVDPQHITPNLSLEKIRNAAMKR